MPVYDPGRRKRTSNRRRGERGRWVYVPAAEFAHLRPALREAPPYYRVRAMKGGNEMRLYFYADP